jgi:Rod binding domain-containing protein
MSATGMVLGQLAEGANGLASRPVLDTASVRLQANTGVNSGENAHGMKAASTPRERKLQQAAGQFESMLLSNLWKSMKSAFDEDDSEYSDPAHGAMDEWGMNAMCGAVGKSGGLGIAKLIMKDLQPKIAASQAPKGGSGIKALTEFRR